MRNVPATTPYVLPTTSAPVCTLEQVRGRHRATIPTVRAVPRGSARRRLALRPVPAARLRRGRLLAPRRLGRRSPADPLARRAQAARSTSRSASSSSCVRLTRPRPAGIVAASLGSSQHDVKGGQRCRSHARSTRVGLSSSRRAARRDRSHRARSRSPGDARQCLSQREKGGTRDGASPARRRRFRTLRGSADYPHFARIITACAQGEGDERVETVEGLASGYDHLDRCDPDADFARGGGRRPAGRLQPRLVGPGARRPARLPARLLPRPRAREAGGSARRSSPGTRRGCARSQPSTTSSEKLLEAWGNDRNVAATRAHPRRRLRARHLRGRDGAARPSTTSPTIAPRRARDPACTRRGHPHDLGGRRARRSATTGATSSRPRRATSGSSRSRTSTRRSGRSPGTTRASPARCKSFIDTAQNAEHGRQRGWTERHLHRTPLAPSRCREGAHRRVDPRARRARDDRGRPRRAHGEPERRVRPLRRPRLRGRRRPGRPTASRSDAQERPHRASASRIHA